MDPREALNKAAISTQEGANWNVGTPAASTSMRGASAFGDEAEVHLTDAERTFLIDTVVDESSLLREIRRYDMKRSRVSIPRMTIGEKVLQAYGAVDLDAGAVSAHSGGVKEGHRGAQQTVGFETIELISSKLTLPWTVTNEFLEDNPEQGGAEAKIAKLMGIQAANDLEDLALNGDESGVDVLYRANDGFIKLAAAQAPAANKIAVNAEFTQVGVLGAMLRALPTKYRRDLRSLRFYVGPNTWQDYVDSIAARQGDMADRYMAGLTNELTYGGVPLRMTPFMPENGGVGTNEATVLLVHPDNLIWGVERDMQLLKTREGREAIQNDVRFYALHIRCDFQIQNPAALVLATGVKPRAV